MGLGRDLLRAEAKKLYKEQVKGVPKKNRIPFPDFYKRFKQMKAGKPVEADYDHDHSHDEVEDFDVSQVANINKVEDTTKINGPGQTISPAANIRRTGHK